MMKVCSTSDLIRIIILGENRMNFSGWFAESDCKTSIFKAFEIVSPMWLWNLRWG